MKKLHEIPISEILKYDRVYLLVKYYPLDIHTISPIITIGVYPLCPSFVCCLRWKTIIPPFLRQPCTAWHAERRRWRLPRCAGAGVDALGSVEDGGNPAVDGDYMIFNDHRFLMDGIHRWYSWWCTIYIHLWWILENIMINNSQGGAGFFPSQF